MGEKREERLQGIIEAAISEFIEKGYASASMESIARRANLSKGGLYHHFKSKTEILYTVNLKFLEPVQHFIGQIEEAPTIVEALSGYIRNYLSYWAAHRRELSLYFLIMNESLSSLEINELYRNSTRELFDYFEGLIQQGQDQGLFKKRDARSHAIALISCLDGFLGYVLIDAELSIERISEEIQQTFIRDLLL